MLFYVLKRIHILVLGLIFIFGMSEVNIYYIGLLFFVMAFATSLPTYRRYADVLVIYSSFFIFIQYLWSLL